MSNPIIGVAVRQGTVCICLPAPNRHHDCMYYGKDVLGLNTPIGAAKLHQGFYDARGTFLDRETALLVAKENNQLIGEKCFPVNELFSEDLW